MSSLKVFICAAVLLVSSANLYAEEATLTGYASTDIMSNYVWRGQKLSNSWVVQPSIGLSYKGFSANLWANYDSDRFELGSSEQDHGEVTETDVALSYSTSFGKLTLGGGYIYYAFDIFNDTQEVFVTASYDTLLKPALTLFYDYDEGNGAFIVASLGHSFPVSNMTLNLGASAGFNINNKIMGFDEDGEDFSNFYNGEVSASLNIPVYKSFAVTPKIAYSFALSNDAKDALSAISDDGKKNILYGGINLAVSF